jgi:hypothetical protein
VRPDLVVEVDRRVGEEALRAAVEGYAARTLDERHLLLVAEEGL